MILKHYLKYFPSAFSDKLCDEILAYALTKKESVGTIGSIKDPKLEEKDLHKTRKSNVVWLDDRWIYRLIHPYIHTANKNAGWNFEWDFSEACQFTKYKLNQYYDWHSDSWEEAYGEEEKNIYYRGKIRKLSVTCQLTDESEYVGGELEFQFRNKDKSNLIRKCPEVKPKGSIVVFPSFVWHRVKPVTKGTRYSLVCWNLGYPFR